MFLFEIFTRLTATVTILAPESLIAFELCSRLEGIIPALEPAHALHITGKLAAERKGEIIIMNMCGRGDKDLSSVLPLLVKN